VLFELGVYDAVFMPWSTKNNKYNCKLNASMKHFGKDDTGILIFGPGQDNQLKFFTEEQDTYKILFKSSPCINDRYSKVQPRNTVVVFELADKETDVTDNQVRTVPEVQT
jgi:hypothetical protein